ncbi:ceramidase domain-containing protein [Photobacterium galatheae]|nr:ceramidase domain-containing protein [Photobacterium galatheae]
MQSTERLKAVLLITSALVLLILVLSQSPITQPADFYQYADTRTRFGVPNFVNVISNLPFAIIGLLGIRLLSHTPKRQVVQVIEPNVAPAYFLFFQGLLATAIGSAYYHLTPTPFSLMLDRIPICLAFLSLYCIMLSEYIHPRLGQRLLFPLNLYGLLAVIYWYVQARTGDHSADLSAYVLVQLLPVLHVPMILFLYEEKRPGGGYYLAALISYGLAKLAEYLDSELFSLTGEWISGHSLKHLLAALSGWWIYLLLKKRLPQQ